MRYPEELLDDPSNEKTEALVDSGDDEEWTWLSLSGSSMSRMRWYIPRTPMFDESNAGTILENMRHGVVMF